MARVMNWFLPIESGSEPDFMNRYEEKQPPPLKHLYVIETATAFTVLLDA